MKKSLSPLLILLCAITVLSQDEPKFPPMPSAVSGNAVASLKSGFELFSLMGVGPKKDWNAVTNDVYIMTVGHAGRWTTGRQVPGPVGRLNASAAGVKGVIVLMGGYVVDNQGGELTVPDVNVYEPGARRWSRGKDLPVAVDSAVVAATHDHFIYLIGGRSPNGPVNSVQLYDIDKDTWTQATPYPGTPAFGMAGGIADENMVIIDGAKAGASGGPRYVAADECWLGKIDRKDPARIEWSKLPAHPGPAHFGIAGGGSDREHRVYFSGGTTTPHNYKGVSYGDSPDGNAKANAPEVSSFTFDFDVHTHKWETLTESMPDSRADGRGLLETALGPVVLGGLARNMAVTAGVTLLPKK
jgi:hypothetical protein